MGLWFSISELVIAPKQGISLEIADKLLEYHIGVMNPIRERLGCWITASENSGYRHKEYERLKGRVPTDPSNPSNSWSRHTFSPLEGKDPLGKGAVDWTSQDMAGMGRALLDSPYSRLCYYPKGDFIHADYGYEERGQRLFMNTFNTESQQWQWEQVHSTEAWLKQINR